MVKPMFGFTYPTVTGENTPKGAAFSRILQDFPDMQLWSVYYDGFDLPSWTEAWFADVPENQNLVYLISVKSSDVVAIAARMNQMPAHLRGRIILFLHHEPDQWRSTSDRRGDPDPEVWKQRQSDFLDELEGTPAFDWLELWVCFTEDRWRTDETFCRQHWGDTFTREPRIKGTAFDCFNIGRSITRAGSDIFGVPLRLAREWFPGVYRKLLIREYGQVTPVDQATDSQQVADQVAENWSYAKAQNEIDNIFLGIVWYYNHNNTLVDPSGLRPGRPLTMGALQAITTDSMTPDGPTPDPTHPQYILGRESRQGEIDELLEQINTLEGTVNELESNLTDALNQASIAHQQGRLSAFADMQQWAANQT